MKFLSLSSKQISLTVLFCLSYNLLSAQFYKKLLSNKQEDKYLLSAQDAEYMLKSIKGDMLSFSSERFQGRLSGSNIERQTGMFIQSRMTQNGLLPYQRTFRHPFQMVRGKAITPETRIKIANKHVFVPEEAFPVPFSASKEVESFIFSETTEPFGPWLIPLYQSAAEANDPNFDWERSVYERTLAAKERGVTAVLFFDQFGSKYPPTFNSQTSYETLDIPVVILQKKTYDEHVKDMKVITPFYLNIKFRNEYGEGNNVIGFIDNNALKTVIVGAHYDQFSDKEVRPDGGEADNASGISAMLALSKLLKNSSFKKYNYVFIAFSGHNQGYAGAKSFVENSTFNPLKIAYMINLNQIASLAPDNKLYIGGVGTSRTWNRLLEDKNTGFKFVKENSGLGASEHSLFCLKDIPVLYFSTGASGVRHNSGVNAVDYKGAAAVVEYVYQLIGSLDGMISPVFSRSEAAKEAAGNFQVDIGIEPDFGYKGIGVMVQTVEEGLPANKSGILPGDLILEIGSDRIESVQSYETILSRFDKGDTTQFKIKRGSTVQHFSIAF